MRRGAPPRLPAADFHTLKLPEKSWIARNRACFDRGSFCWSLEYLLPWARSTYGVKRFTR
jgi:hypothetical protein